MATGKGLNVTEQHMQMDFFVVKSKLWSGLVTLWLYLFVVGVD